MEDPTVAHIAKRPKVTTEDELRQYLGGLGTLKRDTTDLRKDLRTAVGQGDLTRAITLLVQSLDAKQNIHWISCPTFKGKRVILRDARACQSPPAFSSEPYVMMGLNSARATLDLLEIAKRNSGADKELLGKAAQFVKDIAYTFFFLGSNTLDTEHAMACLTHFNSVLATHLANAVNIKYEDAIKRLNAAKEFANLKEPSKHIITLLNLENAQHQKKTVFEAEIALTDLTQGLRNEYNNRSSKDWYQLLEPWQRQLVDYYKDILIEGRVLPTQLRNILVGLRNSYLEINGTYELNNVAILSAAYRSGAIAYLPDHKNHKVMEAISKLNMEQLFAHTLEAKTLVLTLNTDSNPSGNDKDIVNHTKNAMGALRDGLYTNLPMNAIRRVTSNHYEGIEGLMKLVKDTVFDEIKHRYRKLNPQNDPRHFFDPVQHYLNGKGLSNEEENLAIILLEGLEDVKASLLKEQGADREEILSKCEIISLALCIGFLRNNNKSPFDPDNRNLVLGCFANSLISELRRYYNVAMNSSCESGKDRTGIMMFRIAAVTFNYLLFNQWGLFSKDEELHSIIQNNLIMLASAGHQQLLSGFQTACGSFGVKDDSEGAIPKNEFPQAVTELLIKKTASYNKEILHKKDLAERFMFPIGDANLKLQKERLEYLATVLLNNCEHSKSLIFDYSTHEKQILIELIRRLQNEKMEGREEFKFPTFQRLHDFVANLCLDLNKHVNGKGYVYASLITFAGTLCQLASQEQPAPAPVPVPSSFNQ